MEEKKELVICNQAEICSRRGWLADCSWRFPGLEDCPHRYPHEKNISCQAVCVYCEEAGMEGFCIKVPEEAA